MRGFAKIMPAAEALSTTIIEVMLLILLEKAIVLHRVFFIDIILWIQKM